MKDLREKLPIVVALVVAAILTIVLTIVFSDGDVNEPEVYPSDPPDTRYYPTPNSIYMPLEANLTNLVNNQVYTLQGDYAELCDPYFEYGALPNNKVGNYLYVPCSSPNSRMLTSVTLGSAWTQSIWVISENYTYNTLLAATNLNVQVKIGNASLLGVSLEEFDAGSWTFVAVSYANSKFTLYVNSNITEIAAPSAPSGPLSIFGPMFNGGLSSLRGWNFELSQSEVMGVYELS